MKNNLKKLRVERGISTEKLSEISDLSVGTINKLENNGMKMTAEYMDVLGKALNVQPWAIAWDVEQENTCIVNEELLHRIIELSVENARAHPKLPVPLIVSVVLHVYANARSGKIPEVKKGGKKLGSVLSNEASKLIDFKISEQSSN